MECRLIGRTKDFDSFNYGSTPYIPARKALLAQLVEHSICNRAMWVRVLHGAPNFKEIMLEKKSLAELLSYDRIFIDGAISFDTIVTVASKIDVSKNNTSPLVIFLSSHGGDIQHGLSVGFILRESPREIIVVNMGYCESIALAIVAMAKPGNRYSMVSSSFFIHSVKITTDETIDWSLGRLCAETNDVQILSDKLISCLESTTKMNKRTILDLMVANNGFGTFIQSKEALEYGIIDHIIDFGE